MLRLGDYTEDDAKSIADHLRKAGIKVELKPSMDASIETEEFLQGRFSELKDEIEDEDVIEKHERYINAIKKIFESKPSPEEFEERYVKEFFPSIDELRTKLKAMAEMEEQKESNEADDSQKSQTNVSEEDANLDDEIQETVSELLRTLIESDKAKDFAFSALSLNEIEPGEDIGNRLDDPIVAIPVDLDDFGIDHPKALRVLSVYLDKSYELYVDEFSVLNSSRLDDEFIDTYTDENVKIMSLNLLLSDLMENHTSEKMDFQTFREECVFFADSEDHALKVIGYSAADEIAKILEKNGMIKIKGDSIRWKK